MITLVRDGRHEDSRPARKGTVTPAAPRCVIGVQCFTRRKVDVDIHEHLLGAIGAERGVGAADRLCEACVILLGVDAAAISLVFDGANTGTLGASSAPARVWDELQFTVGEGPCLDSVASRAPVVVADLDDMRWPLYGPAMLAQQVRAVCAFPVVVAGQYVGALDLFRAAPGRWSGSQLTGALVAAELAEMPLLDLLDTDLQAAATDPDSDAWIELNALSRVEVSQATGMLIAQLQITPAAALVRLRAHAYVLGRSVTDVARDILAGRLRMEAN